MMPNRPIPIEATPIARPHNGSPPVGQAVEMSPNIKMATPIISKETQAILNNMPSRTVIVAHILSFLGYSIDLVMGADIDQDNFLVGNDEFQADPIADVDRDRVQAGQPTFQGMQTKGRMLRVDFQELQGFPVLSEEFWVALDKLSGSSYIAFRVDQPIRHRSAF